MLRISSLLLLAALSFAASASWTCTPIVPGCVCQTSSSFTCDDVDHIRQDFRHKFASLLDATTPQQIRANPLATTVRLGRFKGGIVRLAFHDAAEFNSTQPNSFLDGSPRFRADGCVDLSNGGNAGLDRTIDALQPMWLPYCSKISRADFWYLAAKITVEESTPYTKIGNPFLPIDPTNGQTVPPGVHNVTNFTIPFFVGRVDRVDCALAVNQPESLPAAEGGALEIKRSLMDNLGLDPFHTAALMGAHTLGGAAASGYHGTWTARPDLFNVDYYHQLTDVPWRRVSMPNPTPGGAALQQWNRTNNNKQQQPRPQGSTFMLNTDIAMIYNVAGSLVPQLENSLPQTCPALQPPPNGALPNAVTQGPKPPPPQGGASPKPQPPQGGVKPLPPGAPPQPPQGGKPLPPGAPSQPPQGSAKPQPPVPSGVPQPPSPTQPQGRGGCPFTRIAYSQLNFETAITAFTHGTPQTGDMPGAQIWLDAFSRAFTYMAGVGYSSGELSCLPCGVFSCVNCNAAALCGTTNAYVRHGGPRMTMTMTPEALQSGSNSNSNGPFGQVAADSKKGAASAAHSATIAASVIGAVIGVALLSVGSVAWIRRHRCSSRTCPEAAQEEGPAIQNQVSANNMSDIVLTEKAAEIELPAVNAA